jgi:SAM-dependent methyltransferase
MLSTTNQNGAQSYNQVGTAVVQILGESIEICNRQWNGLDKVLEVDCNYGRIIRQLVTKIDPSRVYGCDILEEGPKFCATEFKINALPPTFDENFPKVPTFDLVYLLSVFTHLSDSVITLLLRDIDKSMNPGAVLMFSTHGPISASKVEIYGSSWVDKKDKIRKAMDESGSYFEEYHTAPIGLACPGIPKTEYTTSYPVPALLCSCENTRLQKLAIIRMFLCFRKRL